jgi:hypothetical protein
MKDIDIRFVDAVSVADDLVKAAILLIDEQEQIPVDKRDFNYIGAVDLLLQECLKWFKEAKETSK